MVAMTKAMMATMVDLAMAIVATIKVFLRYYQAIMQRSFVRHFFM
jgi:hypothetical protein